MKRIYNPNGEYIFNLADNGNKPRNKASKGKGVKCSEDNQKYLRTTYREQMSTRSNSQLRGELAKESDKMLGNAKRVKTLVSILKQRKAI